MCVSADERVGRWRKMNIPHTFAIKLMLGTLHSVRVDCGVVRETAEGARSQPPASPQHRRSALVM